jgi:hypothetical protein
MHFQMIFWTFYQSSQSSYQFMPIIWTHNPKKDTAAKFFSAALNLMILWRGAKKPDSMTSIATQRLHKNAYFSGNEYTGMPLPRKLPRQQRQNCWVPAAKDTLANATSKTERTLGQGVLSPVREEPTSGYDTRYEEESSQRRSPR